MTKTRKPMSPAGTIKQPRTKATPVPALLIPVY